MTLYNNKIFQLLRMLAFAVISSFLISSCVTTETGIFTKKADDKKALESSVQLAKKYISERKWNSAKRHLKNALELDKNSAEVHEAMALVFQNTGELERAEEHFEEAIDIAPSFSRTRLNYAAFLYSQERYVDAVKQLEIVSTDTLYNKRKTAFISLGRCYVALGRYEDAEKTFKRAYLMGERHSPHFIFQMADVYYQLKDYARSQRFYDQYGRQTKTKTASALLLGARLAKQFDDKNALSSYGLALKNLYPRSKEYLTFKQEFVHGS